MSGKIITICKNRISKNFVYHIGIVLAFSLCSSALTALLLTDAYNRAHFQALGSLCQEMITSDPQMEPLVLHALKTCRESSLDPAAPNILSAYGYQPADFLRIPENAHPALVPILLLLCPLLLFLPLLLSRQRQIARIENLTDYLEQVNTGNDGMLPPDTENAVSKLQDEIYKTVTALRQTKDTALKAKENFASNLANIAHQIKTPITALSLSAQMMEAAPSPAHITQIRLQLSRLSRLEEALLLLSRIDAGTLPFERKAVDVFTLLTLAADNLQELFAEADVSVIIPETEQITVCADLDWTMEAIINLLKNCMEHTPAKGTVLCSYEQNPLYTQILIQDTGSGFDKEDIPHLFERFYRGQNAAGGGIGIGLSLAKAIIESQNGILSARNSADGGACFEIRLYSH